MTKNAWGYILTKEEDKNKESECKTKNYLTGESSDIELKTVNKKSALELNMKHDLWWNADITLEKGLVDEIRVTERKYAFSRGLLDI